MSSLKMTFSLASLILFIALGLVFAPTAVMAHEGTVGNLDHDHPLLDLLPAVNLNPLTDNDTDDPGEAEVTAHMHHPKVASITLKAADGKVKGNQVKIATDAADPPTKRQFTIVIDFDRDVTSGDGTSDTAASASPLANTEITMLTLNAQKSAALANVNEPIAAPTRFTKDGKVDNSKFEALVTVAPAAVPTGTKDDALEKVYVRFTVQQNTVVGLAGYPSGASGKINGSQNPGSIVYEFTLVTTLPVDKEPFTVTLPPGEEPSLTDDFRVIFTANKTGVVLKQTDIEVTNGTVIRFGKLPNPPAGTSVYEADVRPALYARMVTVTIKKDVSVRAADGDMGKVSVGEPVITAISLNPATANDEADFDVIFTFNRALSDSEAAQLKELKRLSIGTMSSDMKAGDKATLDPLFLAAPSLVPGETMKWRVTVSPKLGANTVVGLSAEGMKVFGYATGVTAKTILRKDATAPTASKITATYDATEMQTTLSGAISANGFAYIDHTALPDLERFFGEGGSITLHNNNTEDDEDSENSGTVVISEILWGLNIAEETPPAKRNDYQFVELYNTTKNSIDLTNWKLKFKKGRPAPSKDIDQVSNVDGAGWIVDVGQSGAIALGKTPVNIISMYRDIDYIKVEAGGDGYKDGVPNGNEKVSWKASTKPGSNAGVLDSKGQKHFTEVQILKPTAVPHSPFVINEIGNGTNGTNDWVELRNVTGSEQSLKGYQFSVVTGEHDATYDKDKHSDKRLFSFDRDYMVPGHGVIVVTSTHPNDTVLATGNDVSMTDANEEKKGATHLYVVRSFNIPDSGRKLFILRNDSDMEHLGTANGIVDIAGTLKIKSNTATLRTSLWPLQLGDAPNDDVIDGGAEDFAAGYVYIREVERDDEGHATATPPTSLSGTGEKHFSVAEYTGLGYDRAAVKSKANGGTPGYPNDAIINEDSAFASVSMGQITFSEIMLETGNGGTALPQWIEIYNSSMTHAVDLDGWKLRIEQNASKDVDGAALDRDVITELDTELTFSSMIIPPNQTILIVTTTGRVSHRDHFPSTRVINLWTTHRKALGMTKRTEKVFSTNGLYLALISKDDALVDEFGNLDGKFNTADPPNWEIPMGEDENRRSSLVRRYDAQAPKADGTDEKAWVLAEKTDLAFVISQTYYGDQNDFGTPGFRAGGPLPVSLSKFRPERLESGEIVIRWMTESELNNAGFNILRSETRNGQFTKINTSLIAGQGTTSERTTYSWMDTSAKPNVVYYYQIQDVSLDGQVQTLRQSRLKGDVSPAGKLTTQWAEIKALQ